MELSPSLIKGDITRVVESQSYNATRQLVDSDAEQEVLEQLLDENKPPYPKGTTYYHYLLKTPFRYPPLPYGSRFGGRNEAGIFYGSIGVKGALCEAAYYRLLFIQDSAAKLRPSYISYTSFAIGVDSKNGLDLTSAKWRDLRHKVSDPLSHVYAQAIGQKARAQGIDIIRYYSAREVEVRNLAVFTPNAFASKAVKGLSYWDAYVDENTVTFTQKNTREVLAFIKDKFLIHGVFPVIQGD